MPMFFRNCPSSWLIIACAVGLSMLVLLFLLWRRAQARQLAQLKAGEVARDSAVTALQESMLQSAQGLILRFEAIAKRLPLDHPTRRDLVEALDRAERVLEQGLDRAQHLRDQTAPPKDFGTHRHS